MAGPSKLSETPEKLNQSGLVKTSQTGVHPSLEKHLRRHMASPWLQPFHQATVREFEGLLDAGIFSGHEPVILDSGCGTGQSTRKLAKMFPGHLVIGADRSQARLGKSGMRSSPLRLDNCLLIRAELSTFWRLLIKAGITPEYHYLLYPNPCPKHAHLTRRWHGHPVFPQLLRLGGQIELRCNWDIYALEFAMAASILTGKEIVAKRIDPEPVISPFEQKYLDRGQALFSVVIPAVITAEFKQSPTPD